MSLSDRRVRWLVGVIALGAAGGIAFAFLPAGSDPRQIVVVEAAFAKAIGIDRDIQAPPASRAGGVAPPATTGVRKAQLQDGEAALARYFAPALADREQLGLISAVNAEADPKFRNLGSGVSKVVFDSAAVSGDTATLHTEVTVWSKFQQQQADGSWATSDPVNVMIYNVTMTRDSSSQWIVTSMVGDFAPGHAP